MRASGENVSSQNSESDQQIQKEERKENVIERSPILYYREVLLLLLLFWSSKIRKLKENKTLFNIFF